MVYGIAVFPSQEIADFADLYRRRYDPQYALIQPHLTLRPRENWTEEQLQDVTIHLEQTTRGIKPFELHFNRFSSFYPAGNVIYMALSDTKPMQTLYSHLSRGSLGEPDKPYAYVPHLTVAQNLSDDELHDVLGSLRPVPLDLRCTIDHVELLQKSDGGSWRRLASYPLRAAQG